METGSIKEKILAAAEKRVRHVGYNAVSFRDLAADVGVKSSSVHYHFLKKKIWGKHWSFAIRNSSEVNWTVLMPVLLNCKER